MENTRNFTHLHVHTGFSLLDGSSKIKELVKKTKELGMDSIAITDHGVMYGLLLVVKYMLPVKADLTRKIVLTTSIIILSFLQKTTRVMTIL